MTSALDRLPVWKGHGTENDFILIDDRDGELELTAQLVRALCDRRSGIGADGVLRVVRSTRDHDALIMADRAPFFMDYRNADGSVAEMCGNGIRLFALYLTTTGAADAEQAIATRGGVRRVVVSDPAAITVAMGPAQLLDAKQQVTAHGSSWTLAGQGVRVPNPHVVVDVGSTTALDDLDLSSPPLVEPGLADGQNVEFVARTGLRRLSMRVHERGSGETRSCGTGICAAVAAVAVAELGPDAARDDQPWRVDVPGGSCQVRWSGDGELLLTGPAALVGQVDLDPDWLGRVVTSPQVPSA